MNFKNLFIKEIINNNQGIRIDEFISNALFKKNSYYSIKNPIGSKGDFITSPEISQMFGEILGAYILNFWINNIKSEFNLIELGPGKGTLLNDLLRTTKLNKKFNFLVNIILIENNKKLIQIQKKNILKLKTNDIIWLKKFNIKSKLPSIIVGNEFFDCLPIRQFYKNSKWLEKLIINNKTKKIISFIDEEVKDKKLLKKLEKYEDCGVAEISKERSILFKKLCKHIYLNDGLIILIDYGYKNPIKNFTLQSTYNHKKTHLFDNLGLQDITSHVDFNELINIAKEFNLKAISYMTQRNFLISNGIFIRKEKLKKNVIKEKKEIIEKEYIRLTDNKKMGGNFKVLIISSK